MIDDLKGRPAMRREDLEKRTRRFAVNVIVFSESLKPGRANDVIARQLIKAASSIGANYREAVRAESRDDFIHKLNISSKEAGETEYWLELLHDLRGLQEVKPLLQEADELLRILTASVKTARTRRRLPTS